MRPVTTKTEGFSLSGGIMMLLSPLAEKEKRRAGEGSGGGGLERIFFLLEGVKTMVQRSPRLTDCSKNCRLDCFVRSSNIVSEIKCVLITG